MLAMMVFFGSLTFPVFFGFCMIHELEPTHLLIYDLLEVDIQFKPDFIPFFALMAWLVFTASNTVCTLLILCILYYNLTYNYLVSLCPTQYISNRITTLGFGNLAPLEFNVSYRTLQVFTQIMNQITASICFSMHFVVCMAVFVALSYACISFPELMFGSGVALAIMAAICLLVAPIIIYFECFVQGLLADANAEVFNSGSKLFRRKPLLSKSFKSFSNIVWQTAFPFFVVDLQTFPQFIQQAIDFLITLLVA